MESRGPVRRRISQSVMLLLLLLLVGIAAHSGGPGPSAWAVEDEVVDAIYIPIVSRTSESIKHSLTLTVSGNGQVIADPDKNIFDEGESVTLTAIPDSGLTFNGWSGDLSGSSNPAILIMDADKNVTADFTVTVASVYYLSPNGNDNNSGTSELQAWATFDRALKDWPPTGDRLKPGDTLILLDGIYYQSLEPSNVAGEPGNPITVRALNDGQAIIDGQHQRIPVNLRHWMNPSHYVIEGIVAKNSSGSVYMVDSHHNVLRRVSGYNANTDGNHVVFWLWGDSNLLEDCVAAGSGRKMIIILDGEHNTVRRCFADWQEWDGRERHECWPWGDGIEIYNSSYNIVENSISYSRNPTQAINLLAQGGVHSIGNKVLGSMAIMAGMKEDGTPMVWGVTRPQPSQSTCVRNFSWPGQRSGFNVYESGSMIRDNLWQDILSWGNAGLGVSWIRGVTDPNTGNNRINRATIFNNGLDNPGVWGGVGIDALQADLDRYGNVTNSYIETIYTGTGDTSMSGEGARLTHRYIDGVLTDEPLWPWPMENRIQDEMGISVTDLMTDILSQLP